MRLIPALLVVVVLAAGCGGAANAGRATSPDATSQTVDPQAGPRAAEMRTVAGGLAVLELRVAAGTTSGPRRTS